MVKKVESPKLLWDLFEKYKQAVKEKPRFQSILNPKAGTIIQLPLEVPLTKEGFYNFCAKQGVIETLKDYFANKEERYTEFATICSRIRDEIRQDQIEGGMVGQYNPSITQRLNGLSEKTELSGPDGGAIPVQQITGMEVL